VISSLEEAEQSEREARTGAIPVMTDDALADKEATR